MTATQVAARHIVQQLMHRHRQPRPRGIAERMISGLALAAGGALLLGYLGELLWVVLAVTLVVSLGLR